MMKPEVWTALITPFRDDGKIDWSAFDRLVENQLEAGISGLVISGTTGEAPALSKEEKLSLLKKAKELCQDKAKVMFGSGSNNTYESAELSLAAKDAGADSLLVVTPPYNKPNLSGLIKHFETISKSAGLPICLYHVPGRTAQLLSAEAIHEICQVDGIVSVKEASGDLSLFSRVVGLCHDKKILTGDDPTYLPTLSVGGSGVISVMTNAFPKAFVEMSQFWAEAKTEEAREVHRKFFPMIEALFCETNPVPVKAVLELMGLCSGNLRLPLCPVSSVHKEFLKKSLEALEG